MGRERGASGVGRGPTVGGEGLWTGHSIIIQIRCLCERTERVQLGSLPCRYLLALHAVEAGSFVVWNLLAIPLLCHLWHLQWSINIYWQRKGVISTHVLLGCVVTLRVTLMVWHILHILNVLGIPVGVIQVNILKTMIILTLPPRVLP